VSGSEIYGTTYTRDALGRITRIDETIQGASSTKKYEYDAAGRLIKVRDGSDVLISQYTYDGNGARTSAATPTQNVQLGTNLGCGPSLDKPADAQDRLCRYGDNQYSFNANGQLASKSDVVTSGVTTYTYDGLGRLQTVQLPGGTRIDYVLDMQGRRIGKVVNGALSKAWLYSDSLRPVTQVNSAGQIEATFVYETRPNVPEYIVKSGAVYRVLTDHLGSVRLIVNVADGSVAQRIDYDEFGSMILDTNPGYQPFGFAGGFYDEHTRLLRFGARDYDSSTGRWTEKDPIAFEGRTTNLYEYVDGDVSNTTDPSGGGLAYALPQSQYASVLGSMMRTPFTRTSKRVWKPLTKTNQR
jgi:RHS repeat-associated protein